MTHAPQTLDLPDSVTPALMNGQGHNAMSVKGLDSVKRVTALSA